MLRNNLDYIKEQLAREEKFIRKEIEQIKFEQQNLKETFEKVNQKIYIYRIIRGTKIK